MPEKKTFSDSWYRIADKHATLRHQVQTAKQYFRGDRWYVLHDPFRNEFFRVTEQAYLFIARLTLDKTIDDVWRECMERQPELAPGQEEVIDVLAQLNQANLIQSDLPANSTHLFEQARKNTKKKIRSQLINFLFLRIPVFNPDALLNFLKPLGKLAINPIGALVWLGVVGWALNLVFSNFESATNQASGFLSPQNIPWILVATVLLKAIHELAHGIACKHYGGSVPQFGIMLMILMPLPYVDATSSWSFPNKWKRIVVSSAGMIVEIFVAAIATIIWSETGAGMVNAVAYNVMLIASITTILFNLNPLLKFDGYYIFSDLFGLPNLQQRSIGTLRFLMEYYLFGYKDAICPARDFNEGVWLSIYGVASGIYRVFLMLSISFLVAERFFEIGLLLGIFTLLMNIVLPLLKFIRYVFTNSQLSRNRARAIMVTGLVFGSLAFALTLIPVEEHFVEPGIVRSEDRAVIGATDSGYLTEVMQPTGVYVEAGTPLMQLRDPELAHEITQAELAIERTETTLMQAQEDEFSSLRPLRRQVQLEQQRLDRLLERKAEQTIRAPISGLWTSPDINAMDGLWIGRGDAVGHIVNPQDLRFIAVISQSEAANLFNRKIERAEIRLWGRAGQPLMATVQRIIEAEQAALPSPALGWQGGGEVRVKPDDPEGREVVDPFFRLIAVIENPEEIGIVANEQTGKIRLTVGKRPLLFQWVHDIRQLLQERLKL
ncbi:MAG: hypothetical protein AAFX93_01535 [Verrucomicrobiota bacterium]